VPAQSHRAGIDRIADRRIGVLKDNLPADPTGMNAAFTARLIAAKPRRITPVSGSHVSVVAIPNRPDPNRPARRTVTPKGDDLRFVARPILSNPSLIHGVVALPHCWRRRSGRRFGEELFVSDLFHPIDNLSVEPFLNGDLDRRVGWRGIVPMLLTRRELHHIARSNFLYRSALALLPAKPRCDDRRLAWRVGMPGRTSARFERDTRVCDTGRSGRAEHGIDTHGSGEIVRSSFVEGWAALRSIFLMPMISNIVAMGGPAPALSACTR
jgi:hypothetical protein